MGLSDAGVPMGLSSWERSIVVVVTAIACFSSGSPVCAEQGVMVVAVSDVWDKPLKGIILSPRGDGNQGAPTDVTGRTRIQLAVNTKPGDRVTLTLGDGKWAFISPLDSVAIVPSFANSASNFVSVFLALKGDRDMLTSGKAVTAITNSILRELTLRERDKGISEAERKAVLAKQAAKYGLKPEDVDEAIRAYKNKTQDPLELGTFALYERKYPEAEKYLKKAYEREKKEFAHAANLLGDALYGQGKYREAAKRYEEAHALTPEDLAINHSLAIVYANLARYADAEKISRKSLELARNTKGLQSREAVISLVELSSICQSLTKYDEAERLADEALEIQKKAQPPDNIQMQYCLERLSGVYRAQGKYRESDELLFKGMNLADWKRLNDRSAKSDLEQLRMMGIVSGSFFRNGMLKPSEVIRIQALAIANKWLPKDHVERADALYDLGQVYQEEMRLDEAAPLLREALAIRRSALGDSHPSVADSLHTLAMVEFKKGNYQAALDGFNRSVDIVSKSLGANHPELFVSLLNKGIVLDRLGRPAEAESTFKQIVESIRNTLGEEHPQLIRPRLALANHYAREGKFDLAEPEYKRSLEIARNRLSPNDILTSQILLPYAAVLSQTGRYKEAEALKDEAYQIRAFNDRMNKPPADSRPSADTRPPAVAKPRS